MISTAAAYCEAASARKPTLNEVEAPGGKVSGEPGSGAGRLRTVNAGLPGEARPIDVICAGEEPVL